MLLLKIFDRKMKIIIQEDQERYKNNRHTFGTKVILFEAECSTIKNSEKMNAVF